MICTSVKPCSATGTGAELVLVSPFGVVLSMPDELLASVVMGTGVVEAELPTVTVSVELAIDAVSIAPAMTSEEVASVELAIWARAGRIAKKVATRTKTLRPENIIFVLTILVVIINFLFS